MIPRLGNFSRILTSLELQSDDLPVRQQDVDSNNNTNDTSQWSQVKESHDRLGDFRRIFVHFQPPESPLQRSFGAPSTKCSDRVIRGKTSLDVDHAGNLERLRVLPPDPKHSPIVLGQGERLSAKTRRASKATHQPPGVPQRITKGNQCPSAESTGERDNNIEGSPFAVTAASASPCPQTVGIPSRAQATSKLSNETQRQPESRSNILLSYSSGNHNSIANIYGKVRSETQNFEDLRKVLISDRTLDAAMAIKYPTVASHGIHLFIDLSNIDIGFQRALKVKYQLGDAAYFSPLPHLDLQVLTAALLRGRSTVTRSVGCSIVPGRSEPRYIQELQSLDYHVDLRERKPVHDMKSTSSSVRYVEDLVDETLQTRIAESVMEYFQRQGTIILATGDAKPAQYSAGFFTYAERALRMGWNVELVSWRSSLSSTWTCRRWKAQWGDRFRIIELDQLLDLLLAQHHH